MKKNSLIIALLFISVSIANATVWRLNNTPGTDAHFITLQAAHNSSQVLDGDTLYLEASSGTYGNLVSTKKLTIIGSGFFTTENPGSQANVAPSRITDITFNNGSQGSKITGCEMRHVIINTSEIIIERNYIYINEDTKSYLITFNSDNINNIIIRNNYIANNNNQYSSSNTECIRATREGLNNIIIKNNYIYMWIKDGYKWALNLGTGFSGVIENNVIYGYNKVNNAIYLNNILRDGNFQAFNTTIMNNIGNSTQFGTLDGNQSNVNMANVFVGTGSIDGRWQLKEGSPAIGAGADGVDCGMFGGSEPYILSGIPAIPTIYKFDMNVNNVEQKIEVEISVKSRN